MQRVLLALIAVPLAFATSGAKNPFLGTWELNIAKSDPDPSSPSVQSQSVRYFREGAVLKGALTVNGNPSAHPTIYDGQEHEYGGTLALRPTHVIPTAKANALEAVFKRDGKKVGVRRNTLSPDGRTMTVVTEGTKPDGSKYRSVLVYEKR